MALHVPTTPLDPQDICNVLNVGRIGRSAFVWRPVFHDDRQMLDQFHLARLTPRDGLALLVSVRWESNRKSWLLSRRLDDAELPFDVRRGADSMTDRVCKEHSIPASVETKAMTATGLARIVWSMANDEVASVAAEAVAEAIDGLARLDATIHAGRAVANAVKALPVARMQTSHYRKDRHGHGLPTLCVETPVGPLEFELHDDGRWHFNSHYQTTDSAALHDLCLALMSRHTEGT